MSAPPTFSGLFCFRVDEEGRAWSRINGGPWSQIELPPPGQPLVVSSQQIDELAGRSPPEPTGEVASGECECPVCKPPPSIVVDARSQTAQCTSCQVRAASVCLGCIVDVQQANKPMMLGDTDLSDCLVTERQSVIRTLEKIMSLVEHDSPVYVEASEQHSWLKSLSRDPAPDVFDVIAKARQVCINLGLPPECEDLIVETFEPLVCGVRRGTE